MHGCGLSAGTLFASLASYKATTSISYAATLCRCLSSLSLSLSLPMPSAAVSSPTVGAARRVRAVRVPGHLNNAQLVTLLFERRNGATPSEADTGEASSDEWRRQSAASTPPTAAATVPAAAAASVPGSVRYPLNRQLVVFVVRDVARLCCYMPEHVRALIAADEDDELRTVAPSVGAVLCEADEAFLRLVQRLVERLTAVLLSLSAVRELIVASKSMARQSLTMDTRTRRIYLLEQYVPGADNASLSAAVLAASESFRGLQERSWFTSGENPLQRLRLTYPIQPLQQVGRRPCPKCTRKSASHTRLRSRTQWRYTE